MDAVVTMDMIAARLYRRFPHIKASVPKVLRASEPPVTLGQLRSCGEIHAFVTCNNYWCGHIALVPLAIFDREMDISLADVRMSCIECGSSMTAAPASEEQDGMTLQSGDPSP